MLKLFSNLFGRVETESSLPSAVVKQLVERAVDGTDPRLRIVSGYARTLREPVIHAAEHVIGMIDSLAAPVSLKPLALHECPILERILYSEVEARKLLARDPALVDYRGTNPPLAPITALLVVQRSEKRGFGTGQVGDRTVRDMARTTVSFTRHLLLEPSDCEADTRLGLKRRAFDHLLAISLAKITERREERKDLHSRRALLRSKLEILQRGGGFTRHTAAGERASLQSRLERIEQQLAAHGPPEEVLEANLGIVSEVLGHAEQHLWREEAVLDLDRFYVLHDQPDASVPRFTCQELRNSEGQRVMLQLVKLTAP